MKGKKSVIILFSIMVIGVVGLTVAYFSDFLSITNEFHTVQYGSTAIEKFVSPDAWAPGTTTEKKLKVKNTGEVDEAVRISYSETWVTKKGNLLPSKQNDNDVAIINWANRRDWIQDGNTFYYKYKLTPQEETSSLINSVTFNIAVLSDIECTENIDGNVKTRTCSSSGDGYDDATYTLTFTIETVQFNNYRDAWELDDNSNITISSSSKPVPMTIEQFASNKTNSNMITSYNDESADKTKMFTFTHEVGDDTITESRYIGDIPNNYVEFNCDDDGSNCELWRIVGLFDVEKEIDDEDNPGEKTTITESRMKLVRGATLKNDYWNTNASNDWTTSTLKTYLNTVYYSGLKSSAKGMIDEAKYYLGASDFHQTTEQIYTSERGNIHCGACNNDDSKLTWQGYIGLMYASDQYMVYGYDVNEACYSNPSGCTQDGAENGWIYNSNKLATQPNPSYVWLLPSEKETNFNAFYGSYNGNLVSAIAPNLYYGVRPVAYLSSDIKIIDGDGSEANPYALGLTSENF